MKILTSVLMVLVMVTASQAGIILSEDFEGAASGSPVNGYNGWSGAGNIVISASTIDQGNSADWSSDAIAWPRVTKLFSHTPGTGEIYTLTATLLSPTTSGTDSELYIRNTSDPDAQMQGVAICYGDMQFGVLNTANVVKILPQPTAATDVKLVLQGNSSEFYYRTHGAADWTYAGGFSSLGWSIAAYNEIAFSGHGGYAGGLDTIVLATIPEPAVLSLLATGGLLALRHRKQKLH